METQAHGALVRVLEVGILLLGPSGIGKSECALELVARGHALVADDVVCIDRTQEGELIGNSPEVIRHFMEIRGIGIVCVPDLYGATSVLPETRIDLVCRLEPWRRDAEYERVGLERPTEWLAGVRLPSLLLPARPAGSMATLVELVARDHLQRKKGAAPVQRIDERIRREGEIR